MASLGTDFTSQFIQMLPQDSTIWKLMRLLVELAMLMQIATHHEAGGSLLITQQPMPMQVFKQCAYPILFFLLFFARRLRKPMQAGDVRQRI
jgi:hypothetical protein